MVLAFAIFVGLNYSIFLRGGPGNWVEVTQVLGGATPSPYL